MVGSNIVLYNFRLKKSTLVLFHEISFKCIYDIVKSTFSQYKYVLSKLQIYTLDYFKNSEWRQQFGIKNGGGNTKFESKWYWLEPFLNPYREFMLSNSCNSTLWGHRGQAWQISPLYMLWPFHKYLEQFWYYDKIRIQRLYKMIFLKEPLLFCVMR